MDCIEANFSLGFGSTGVPKFYEGLGWRSLDMLESVVGVDVDQVVCSGLEVVEYDCFNKMAVSLQEKVMALHKQLCEGYSGYEDRDATFYRTWYNAESEMYRVLVVLEDGNVIGLVIADFVEVDRLRRIFLVYYSLKLMMWDVRRKI